MAKNSGDNLLSLGQSSAYYYKLKIYEKLTESNLEERPTDISSFIKACGDHVAIGSGLGIAPISGAINGAARCLEQYQMIEQTAEQMAIRWAVDVVAGVAPIYRLSGHSIFIQAIGIVSTVSMSDMATKVAMTTVELGLNGVTNLFGIEDYNDI